MKKKIVIIAIICILIIGGISIYFLQKNKGKTENSTSTDQVSNVDTNKDLLLNVLNNKTKLIDINNKEILFKNYEIPGSKIVEAKEYVFIDLDKDGIEELAINTTSDYGAYIILHAENSKVYGYLVEARSFENLKIDGSFIGSNGANSSEYLTISFIGIKSTIKTEAIYDGINNIYKINDKTVSKQEIEKYVTEWNNKENVKWIQFVKE